MSRSTGTTPCAVRTDGSLACWHAGSTTGALPPIGTFTPVAVGRNHACALRADGTAACWGDNTYGQASAPAGYRFTALNLSEDVSCGLLTFGSRVIAVHYVTKR
jgi:alpha-tubulin suppressor-like RCC1 family protein